MESFNLKDFGSKVVISMAQDFLTFGDKLLKLLDFHLALSPGLLSQRMIHMVKEKQLRLQFTTRLTARSSFAHSRWQTMAKQASALSLVLPCS